MSIAAISGLTNLYTSNTVPATGVTTSLQKSFSALIDEAIGGGSDQQRSLQGVSQIFKYVQDLGGALSQGNLQGAQQIFSDLQNNFIQPAQATPRPVVSAQQTSSVQPQTDTVNVVPETSPTTTTASAATQAEPATMGVASGQSGWYKTVIQPLVDALPSEVSRTYQDAWENASSVKDSAFHQSGGTMGPGVYMYGMTPGGSLIGDWVANPYLDSGSDLGNYTAGAALFKGTDRTAIEQGILDSAAFNAANQAILDKYGYDLRAGDIRIGTGDKYTVYNPVTGQRAAISLKPA